MRIPSAQLSTFFLLGSTLMAQIIVPPSAATTLGGSNAGFPLSYTAYVRYQQAIDKSYLKLGFYYGMAFRSTTAVFAVKERQWQEMRIVLADLTASSVSGMSLNYAANLGTNQKEVFRDKFNIYRPNPSDKLEFNVTIPFKVPFLYLQTAPLVVDMLPVGGGYEGFFPNCPGGGNGTSMDGSKDLKLYSVFGKGSCTSVPTTAQINQASGFVMKFFQSPMLMPFAKGCAGSNGQIPQIGSTGPTTLGSAINVTVTGAAATAKNAVFVLGLDTRLYAGMRLPIDLSGAGATPVKGCWQNIDNLVSFFVPVLAGNVLVPAVIPNNPNIVGLNLYTQFALDDPSASGFTTTQGGIIVPR